MTGLVRRLELQQRAAHRTLEGMRTSPLNASHETPLRSDGDRFRDPSLPVGERVADLLARMTLPEKVGQMMQLDARGDLHAQVLETNVGSVLHASPERILEAHRLSMHTRLRIPLLIGEDCIHGHSFWPGATIFPTQLAMAASWDAGLLEQVARATAVEAAATGIHWTFSPVLCISRDLRWGRVGETFGEDPHLIGELASAMVRGYQGEGLSDPTAILATAKHFAGYSETQGGRDASEADISRRKLRCWFLPPFERVAREGCGTFMLGYQTMDGVPITVNDWLLNEVLRDEWGYTGMLVTDWDNVGRMVWEQHVQPDYTHAAAAAVRAGNDMVMNTPQFFAGALDSVALGLLAPDAFDAAVERILALKFQLGLFENPRPPRDDLSIVGSAAHRALNLEIARRSVVLLENDGVLPLPTGDQVAGGAPLRIALVGLLADDAQTQLGDWAGGSGQAGWLNGQPRDMIVTIRDGFDAVDGWAVQYVEGASIVALADDPLGSHFPDGQPRPKLVTPSAPDTEAIAEAVRAAQAADVVVAVVGDCIELVGEGCSTATLELIGGQIALLEAVIDSGKPVVVVLLASKPLVLPAAAARAAAVLWSASPGMLGGQAIADIVSGAVEPSGRLPISFARHAGQQPTYYNQIRGQHGDRYADLTQSPAWAFGEGRSYTTVAYADLDIDEPSLTEHDTVRAFVTVTNTGTRPVRETVQAYIRDVVTSVSWAMKELKAFRQVDLDPGESQRVAIEVPVAECTLVDAAGHRRVEAGDFELLVGPSSREEDLLAARFAVVRS